MKRREKCEGNRDWHPSRTFSTTDSTKSSIGQPQVFEPQLNCRNMGESGRGSDTVGGGWHMRPSIPTRQLGNDYDTLIKPKN